ncbi:TetR/AcrR family transcriptional regulator [Trujillonella endophytica]|uniref:Transcriptional regulator, TetR family n=1 Tax=Trujillonella endophytica TaxID=673521 RepID=A0A1H8QT77_9ACTN|nr:TetR/AcrR family transcriptional regulator [Trujillella endophytica]SEO57178.1 transcriptional regulator, TetR family [Trujillella endophytica]
MTAVDAVPTDFDWRTYPDPPIAPILAAALTHFQQDGYHGTTVRKIAAEVGLTMPTLYYHYGNKEGLLFALLDIAMDDFWAHGHACLEEAGTDVQKRFENFISSVALHYTHRRDLAMLHDESRFLGPDFRVKYLERRNMVNEVLEGLIKDGVAEGVFDVDDSHLTSLALLGMLGGILDWYRDKGPLSAADIANRYTRYAVRIVSKPAAA